MTERSYGDPAATKLRPPVPPSRLVDRDRLDVVLTHADAAGVPMILVSAPAGSGKSTLVAAWAAQRDDPAAWLQLEESDADPARFWASLVASIARVDPETAARVEPLVAGALGAGQVVVPALVNAIATLPRRLVVVLDDYHLVDDLDVHRSVERLIELSPPQLTLVLITRTDPPFRLGRLRVRGRLCEIRAGDLRFDASEAAALLGPVAETLDAERLAELCERTEGWAAGLVLAGLSLEHTDDSDRFIDAFRGDDHLVAGYLTDELLAVLDDAERERIVEAAVLHRLSGPLLDAVTGSRDGARWLEGLAARNQLVIRLDTVGEWYRLHQLFRDMLLLEARRSIPERLPELHRRAAAWFEASGHSAAAVDHLLAAGDREQAMHLMRSVGPDLLGAGRLRTLRNILRRLAAGGQLDAICSMLSGWDHYLTGRYESAQLLLDQAVATLPSDVDPVRAMPLRINVALGRGDVGAALTGAREVIAAAEIATSPSELTTAVGAAFAWAGLVDEARAVLADALVSTQAERRITAHAMALVAAAVAEFHSAGDDTARAAAQRALDFAATSGLGEYHGIAPAVAIRAATGPDVEGATADAERAVVLARDATTMLGLGFVLVVAGDLLLGAGSHRGNELLVEAEGIIDQCRDPGINRALLQRAMARHRLTGSRPARSTGLVEQLSARELAVLRYLPSTLSLPEIARELYVSPNTVKTQCSAVYRKLGVSDRRAAVQAAREHRLL
jgi:LuxR family maltose regulon positive regulatory protein